MTLDVIYEDDDIIAISKPAGMFVHRSALDRRETEVAVSLLRDQIGTFVYPAHRLDRPTSGVLLFAKSKEVMQSLSLQWEQNRVRKAYLAICRGYTEAAGQVDYAVTNASETQRQDATTIYHRVSTVELDQPVGRYQTARYSLVLCYPLTGRMHQIRRHFKHIFHPILGDTTYGDGKQNEVQRTVAGCDSLMLHALALSICHPSTNRPLTLQANPPDHWQDVFSAFNWVQNVGSDIDVFEDPFAKFPVT